MNVVVDDIVVVVVADTARIREMNGEVIIIVDLCNTVIDRASRIIRMILLVVGDCECGF